VTLARMVDWGFLEREFGAVYTDGRGQLPTRLMTGLAILKHTYDLSDEVLCERWVENPYYQFFCGEEFFQHRLVFDRSSLTRWPNRMAASLAAIEDRPRPGKEPVITPEAKAWLVSLACDKAKEHGYPHELWTTRLLARHAREHGPT
jgi:Transposase domain (DUF772)/Homeodomain-like domain